jgi:hypothetical protein
VAATPLYADEHGFWEWLKDGDRRDAHPMVAHLKSLSRDKRGDVPKELMAIARHFNAGVMGKGRQIPKRWPKRVMQIQPSLRDSSKGQTIPGVENFVGRSSPHWERKSGRSEDRPDLPGTNFANNYATRFLRRIRRVLAPNGSSSNAPAIIVVGSGTAETSY